MTKSWDLKFGHLLVMGHWSFHDRENVFLVHHENLVFFAKLYGIANPKARAMELLTQLGLAQRAGDPVKAFSRGMSQRVAIARALLHEPELLLYSQRPPPLGRTSTFSILRRGGNPMRTMWMSW